MVVSTPMGSYNHRDPDAYCLELRHDTTAPTHSQGHS